MLAQTHVLFQWGIFKGPLSSTAGLSKRKLIYIKKKISISYQEFNLYQKQNISHKELRLPLQTALAALRDVNLDVQISWRGQHFEHLQ